MKTRRNRNKNKKTRKLKGITRCPTCMKNGKDVRLALETRNLIKAIKRSPIHSLLTVGNEILSLPNFKKQKLYIDKLERKLCKKLRRFNITC